MRGVQLCHAGARKGAGAKKGNTAVRRHPFLLLSSLLAFSPLHAAFSTVWFLLLSRARVYPPRPHAPSAPLFFLSPWCSIVNVSLPSSCAPLYPQFVSTPILSPSRETTGKARVHTSSSAAPSFAFPFSSFFLIFATKNAGDRVCCRECTRREQPGGWNLYQRSEEERKSERKEFWFTFIHTRQFSFFFFSSCTNLFCRIFRRKFTSDCFVKVSKLRYWRWKGVFVSLD